ncbi:MAG TPA: biopolymer transporter Tol [Ignavibacteria bacterium]
MKTKILIGISILISLLMVSQRALPQFGKNKVQYKEFKWKFIQTQHFDVYFYQGGESLAEFAAVEAESSLASLAKNLQYNISNRIPLIVFESHNDFQQNNILDEFLPEGVGGVTELFKNRMLIPFEGKYEMFRHVIHHELLHAFMNDMFYGGSIQNIISKNITLAFPTWFNEGMAESQALNGLDKAGDMYIRDAVINNYLPPIEYADGYMAYRAGQSFFSFLMDYYGDFKIGELLNNIKVLGDVDAGFKETFKLNTEELSEKWTKEMNRTYWSDSKTREEITDISKRLTDHTKSGGFYNVGPIISPKGDMFAFISNRDDFFDIFIADSKTGEIIDKIVKGNTTSNFEELQVLTPGLTWSPDGKKIAVSVKAGDNDAIYVIDVYNGDEDKLPLLMNSISYVNWGPQNILAFIGTNGKQSDIYIYNLKTKKIDNLTDDNFSDYIPSWAPDGKSIYFTSDRGDYLNSAPSDYKMAKNDFDTRDLYKIDVDTKKIERITNIPHSRQSYAQFSEDGKKMLYLSDVCGITNIYLRETDSTGISKDKPITNSLNPIDQISLSRDGKKLLFVSLNKGGYDIFSLDNPFDRDIGKTELEPTDFVKNLNKFENKKITSRQDSVMNKNDSTFVQKKDSLKMYGEDIQIKFKKDNDSSRIFSIFDTVYTNNMKFQVENNLNEDGSFKIKNYKVKFSPDLVYGNANYSSFYGVQGVAQIALSDMLGDHRIYLQTSMVIDLKNSDYAVAYYYLPNRIDWGFELFHTARFLLYNRGTGNGDELFRFRNYGGNINFSYPINRFRRFDGGLSVMTVSQENLDNSNEEIHRNTFLVPQFSFVFDNTLFGYTAPIKGTRYNLTTLGTPKLSNDGIGFASLIGDFRHYFKLGDDYSFAFRLTSGASFGPNPQRFYLGGTENWINREFENNNIPISNVEEFAFSTPITPLRGFNFDRISGSKFALTNLELRFPLFKYLIFGLIPLGFADIRGVLFVDAGTAWKDNNTLQLFHKEDGITKTKDLLIGMGFGTRFIFMNFPLKFDVAWNYNMNRFSPPKYYISLGYDF